MADKESGYLVKDVLALVLNPVGTTFFFVAPASGNRGLGLAPWT